MQFILAIICALVPAAVLLWIIYRRDKRQPGPPKKLLKAFGYGILSVFLAWAFASVAGKLTGLDLEECKQSDIPHAFAGAFMLAAVPEELGKFLMLWLLLRKNPYFDKQFDGIVYAVFVGMGFAGVENVLFLLQSVGNGTLISTSIWRGLLSVPLHFFCAVLMGYYYSLHHFGVDYDDYPNDPAKLTRRFPRLSLNLEIDPSLKTAIKILAAPILAHGIYDGIIYSLSTNWVVGIISLILFGIFFYKVGKNSIEKIKRLTNK